MKIITRFLAILLVVFAALQSLHQSARADVLPVISGNTGVPGATLSYFDGSALTATADGNGNYSFSVSSGFAGTVTPSKAGYTVVFTPTSIDYSSTPVTTDQTAQNYTPDTSWWTVSGNAGTPGATLSYNDGSPESVIADGSGNYSLLVPDNFAGTVTPSKTGYSFTPTSIDYSSTPVTANLTAQDYTASAITYTISGNAGVAGATLSYTDGTPKTAMADGNGDYSFSVSYNWAGTVTPSKAGYTFTPASIDYSSTPVLSNLTAQDYTATAITYTISGNAGVAGATLSYTDGTPKTAMADGNGDYSFSVSYNWAGTVTPSKAGYTFTPASIDYSSTPVLSNLTAQDYTATAITYTISGNTGTPGVTLSYTDGTAKTAVSDGSGNYSFTVSYHWSGTVTPSKASYTSYYEFTPAIRSYSTTGANQTAQNYTATLKTAIPTPQLPTGTVSDPTPTYKWVRVTAATQYEFQLFKGATLVYTKTAFATACSGSSCSSTPATVLVDAAYKWKVRAMIGGAWRSFSAFKSFTLLTIPTPQLPTGSLLDTTPTYKWTRITGATQYKYQLFKGSTLVYTKTVSGGVCSGTTCSNTPTTVLSPAAYKWKVQAQVSGVWRPYSVYKSFTVIAQPVTNGSFESGAAGWTQYSTHGWQLITTSFPGSVAPHSGSYAVWLGGDYSDISYIQQQVTIPAGAPYLVYWHWIASGDICGYDFGGVLVNGSVVNSYNLCSSANTGGWVQHSVNLSAYVGQSVTIQIRAETDATVNSNLFVDDVSFQAAVGDVVEPISTPNLDAATMQGKPGLVPQGDAPEGLNIRRVFQPLNLPK